jgi:eukaryotic-like serine/threonine-protein kinase
MELERWHRVDNILQAALALNPAERSIFVDSACDGDEALRNEVVSLLSFEEEGLDIIDTPALEVAACVLAPDQPDLIEGQSVGHFRILSLLGVGGMGEVYLADDTKLGRKIALKLLPVDFSRDRARVRRFQQEARAASALNHPYIVTIHETGEFQDRHFIATEYIEGETLRQRMRRGSLNLAETLDIAIQVAGALGAAHQAGIVHRDIKPENIMLRPDGYVKVLDFGLAKLAEQSPNALNGNLASKVTDTTPGLLMGTVKYMSPEQARGLGVDTRSDIFSLGIVIYEMLTGRAPFEGETASDLIAAILKEEPHLIRRHSPGLTDELQGVVSKALHKDKQKRYQTINDLLTDLMDLKQGIGGKAESARSGSGGSTIASTGSSGEISFKTVASRLEPHKRAVFLAALLLLVAAVSITYGPNLLRHQAEPSGAMKITRLTNNGKTNHAAISRDGKNVVYELSENGQLSLWLKHLPTGRDAQIVAPADIFRYGDLSFSPDGNYIYYIQIDRTDSQNALYRIPVSGGAPIKLLRGIYKGVNSGVTFSPDGIRMAFVRGDEALGQSSLMLANADGTGEQILATRKSPDIFVHPAWSPDGKVIACSAGGRLPDGRNYFNVIEVGIADGEERPISSGRWRWVTDVAWLSDGSGLLMIAKQGSAITRQIWYLSYPGGQARRITNDTNDYNELSLTADSNAVLAVQNDRSFGIWISSAGDRHPTKEITLGANKGDGQSGLSWAPDGKIVYATDVGQQYHIWLMDADGSNRTQLTSDAEHNYSPATTSDGHYIVFGSDRAGTGIWRMDIDGRNLKQLHGGYDSDPHCSADGKWVVYTSTDSGKSTLQKISIEGGDAVQLSDRVIGASAVSPDGRLIAVTYLDERAIPQRWRIALIPFAGGEPEKTFDAPVTSDNQDLRWTPDGLALTYVVTRVATSNIWLQPIDGGPSRQLTDFKSDHIEYFDWSPDGRLAVSRCSESNDAVLISKFK